MDDRHNFCDVCGKPIIESQWDNNLRRSVPTGQEEIETPPGLTKRHFGDGVIHKACLPKLIESQAGAGI
jgi:hypothetical protein